MCIGSSRIDCGYLWCYRIWVSLDFNTVDFFWMLVCLFALYFAFPIFYCVPCVHTIFLRWIINWWIKQKLKVVVLDIPLYGLISMLSLDFYWIDFVLSSRQKGRQSTKMRRNQKIRMKKKTLKRSLLRSLRWDIMCRLAGWVTVYE